ncbi:RepB family plasmid replication initiator protein, partial [Enterococcus faecium]
LDLFFAICSKMRDEGKNEVEFTFHQIRSLSQFKKTSKEAFVNKLKSTYQKLLALIFKEEKGSRTTYFTLFDEFTIDTAEETIS